MNKRDLKLLAHVTRYFMENPTEESPLLDFLASGKDFFLNTRPSIVKDYFVSPQGFVGLLPQTLYYVQHELAAPYNELLALMSQVFFQQQPSFKDYEPVLDAFLLQQQSPTAWQGAQLSVDAHQCLQFESKACELWWCKQDEIFAWESGIGIKEIDYAFVCKKSTNEQKPLQTFAQAVLQAQTQATAALQPLLAAQNYPLGFAFFRF